MSRCNNGCRCCRNEGLERRWDVLIYLGDDDGDTLSSTGSLSRIRYPSTVVDVRGSLTVRPLGKWTLLLNIRIVYERTVYWKRRRSTLMKSVYSSVVNVPTVVLGEFVGTVFAEKLYPMILYIMSRADVAILDLYSYLTPPTSIHDSRSRIQQLPRRLSGMLRTGKKMQGNPSCIFLICDSWQSGV